MTDFSPFPGSSPVSVTAGRARRPVPTDVGPRDPALMDAARQLETTFLSEMLKASGLGEARGAFGGGAGEDQFASFLRQAQARQMVEAGGIGLAESLYRALQEKTDDF